MSVRRALSARKTSATDPDEKVTGMPDIAESKNAALSAPLGMANSGLLISREQKRRTATIYARQADGSLKALPFEMPQRPEFFLRGRRIEYKTAAQPSRTPR
jgi:hypothetical protein